MSEKAMELNNDNFKEQALGATIPVLVDFWAPWCGPCKMIGPIVEELAGEYDGKVLVGKVNVDDNRQVAIDYGVMSIPTLIFFKNGEVVDRVVGYKPKSELKGIIDKLLAI